MSYAGDAAEQVVRMSLETGEVAVRLAGSGAKQVAVMLYAILRDQEKSRGKARLSQMLRSGKELKVFAVRDQDLKRFCAEAKKYGVLYCVLKDKNAKDGNTDILVRAEDASKINRIFERFGLTVVDKENPVKVTGEEMTDPAREQEKEAFLDALFQPAQGDGEPTPPTQAQTGKSPQSEPISAPSGPAARGISNSVRQMMYDIRAERKQTAQAPGKILDGKER